MPALIGFLFPVTHGIWVRGLGGGAAPKPWEENIAKLEVDEHCIAALYGLPALETSIRI